MSNCCSSSTSTCSSSCDSADVTVTEFQTQVIDPNNPQIIVTTTTSTCCDKCSGSSCSSSSCSSSSSSCSSSSSSDCKPSKGKTKCKETCFKFGAIISDTTNQQPTPVEFIMRRANNTVTLQWREFSGTISTNGIPYVSPNSSIPSVAPYKVDKPIGMLFNGRGNTGLVEITPDYNQVRFYFNIDKTGANIQKDDSYVIYGGSTTWIVG